jgi:hypothetical protein
MRRRAKAEKELRTESDAENENGAIEKIPENNFDKSGGNG